MAITIPLVLLFGVIVLLLLRFKALGAGAVAVAVLFGFYLADTGARHTINGLTTAVVTSLANQR